MMCILVIVSAKLFVVAFESSERKWLSVVDPSAAIVHESGGPNGSGGVEDPMENTDKELQMSSSIKGSMNINIDDSAYVRNMELTQNKGTIRTT
jgi:hypothetical protein